MKELNLIFGASIMLLSGCGGVSTVPVNATTTATPGTMISYQFASTSDADLLNNAVHEGLCPNGTDCTTNLTNATKDFDFHDRSINNSVKNYTILYSTPGVLAENREVSGGVIIPNMPTSQLKGVVIYYHETEVSKSEVPSCFHDSQATNYYCSSNATQTYGEALGGIIAAQGYIVIMPDYIGLGYDNKVMHPYVLYPEVNALSGLYMLQAANTMLNKLGYSIQNKNLYLTGYSEGGSYALWAANILQNVAPNFLVNYGLNLKATISMSGAYDLANAQMPMEEANISEGDSYNIANNDNATYAKPVVSSYTMASYGFYDLAQTYDPVFNTVATDPFYNCFACAEVFQTSHKVPDLFIKNGLKDRDIKSSLYQSALAVSYGPQNANNSVKPLINTSILSDQNFRKSLKSASLVNWKTKTPVTFIELAQDSVVTNINTQNAYNGLVAQSGASLVNKLTIENTRGSSRYMINTHDPITNVTAVMPLDHIGSGYYQLIAAMKAIKQYEGR